MAGSKIKLCKQTIEFLINELGPGDRLGLVSYNTRVDVDFELMPMTAEGKDRAVDRLRAINSGAQTNLSGGLFKGIELLTGGGRGGQARPPAEVQSILLLTDGLANHGITNTVALVEALRTRLLANAPGASVFTFGYGGDHDGAALRALSDCGRGLYYFVQHTDEIPR
jgi:Mg-chelatase subunit ChlD